MLGSSCEGSSERATSWQENLKGARGFGTPQQVVRERPLLLVRGKRDPEEGSLGGEVFCLTSSISFFRTNKLSFYFFMYHFPITNELIVFRQSTSVTLISSPPTSHGETYGRWIWLLISIGSSVLLFFLLLKTIWNTRKI